MCRQVRQRLKFAKYSSSIVTLATERKWGNGQPLPVFNGKTDSLTAISVEDTEGPFFIVLMN